MIRIEKTYFIGQFMGGSFATGGGVPKGHGEEVWPDVYVLYDADGNICVVHYFDEGDEPMAAWLLGLEPKVYIPHPKRVLPDVPMVRILQAASDSSEPETKMTVRWTRASRTT